MLDVFNKFQGSSVLIKVVHNFYYEHPPNFYQSAQFFYQSSPNLYRSPQFFFIKVHQIFIKVHQIFFIKIQQKFLSKSKIFLSKSTKKSTKFLSRSTKSFIKIQRISIKSPPNFFLKSTQFLSSIHYHSNNICFHLVLTDMHLNSYLSLCDTTMVRATY